MAVKRDPDTREIKINGRMGVLLSLVDQMAPLFRALTAAAFLAAIPWVIRIEKHLDHPAPMSTAAVDSAISSQVPPEVVRQHLDRIDRHLEKLQGESEAHGKALERLEFAVGILLREDA